MKSIIIIGAGGFIGSELTRRFVTAGYRVVAISLVFNPAFPQSELITRIELDITSSDKLYEMIPAGEYEVFYHLAWRGVNGPDKADPEIQTENIRMVMSCATLAKKLGCKKFLCSGTIAERSVSSLPDLAQTSGGMMYGVAKHCTHFMLEAYCKRIGLDFIWMQFSNIYGPQNKTGNLVSYTIEQLIHDKEATFGPAQQPYDFIFVDDLIEAVFRLGISKTHSNFYYIGSGKPQILRDYLLEIGKQLGKEKLIKIGVRPDDGIVYSHDMFRIDRLIGDIGSYVRTDFELGIRKTIEGYE